MTKRTNFNKWPENMFVCLKKHLPRPLVETGPCDHLASFGKPEKAKKAAWPPKYLGSKTYLWPKCVRSWLGNNAKVRSELVRLFGVCSEFARSSFGVCSEFVRSLSGVRSEFARSLFGVRSEFVRSSFGVCSEFVRSSFGVRSKLVRSSFGVCSFGACSELVHGEPGASEKRLPRKTRSAPYYVACGQNRKKCAHAGFVADHCFLCENSQLPQTQAQSAKIRAEFGLQHNAFCSYRRGGFIVKFFPESSSSPFLLAAKTHFCLDDPKPLSACASSCLTLKFFLVLNRIPHANWHSVDLEEEELKEVNELWLACSLLCLLRCCRTTFR